jgi:hypothetical protein
MRSAATEPGTVRHHIHMAQRITRQQLAQVQTYEQFLELRKVLSTFAPKDLYENLFAIAITDRCDGAACVAGRALIELDPPCPETCERVLQRIHESRWFVSFREIPFYLVTQFGKSHLLSEAKAFLSKLPQQEPRSRVDTIVYWASMAASGLCEPHHYWQWQEVIEGDTDEGRDA